MAREGWAEYMREYRRTHPEYRARNNELGVERMRRYRTELREIIHAAKNRPCADCGGSFHFSAMQFDHVRGVKRYTLANVPQTRRSLKSVREEISKCDIVCANCHAVRTWKAKQWEKREVAA